MGEKSDPGKLRTVNIDVGSSEVSIEQLSHVANMQAKIRISCQSHDREGLIPLEITESELIKLLLQAIQTGILSPEFLQDLRAEFEI